MKIAKIVAGLLIMLAIYSGLLWYSTEVKLVTIGEKVRVDKPGDNYYLVFTQDDQVFMNKDTWFPWKSNSEEILYNLKDNRTYVLTVNGFNLPYFNMYKNIIRYKGGWTVPIIKKKKSNN